MTAREAQAFIDYIGGVELLEYTELTHNIILLPNEKVQVGPYWLKSSLREALKGNHCCILEVSLHGMLKRFYPSNWSPTSTAYVAYTNKQNPA